MKFSTMNVYLEKKIMESQWWDQDDNSWGIQTNNFRATDNMMCIVTAAAALHQQTFTQALIRQ